MQEKLQFIRQKCIEANPSILDLVFGCEMESKGKRLFYVGYNNRQHCMLVEDNEALLFTDEIKTATILGHPIRLADVLYTIRVVYNERDSIDDPKIPLSNIWEEACCRWNKKNDDLRDQSEETINLIHNFLK